MALGGLLIAGTVMLFSCVDKAQEQVKEFASDFATKVSNNQKDSLMKVWPDVVKADSLALSFNPDSIVVEETETSGKFKVYLGQGADIMVNKAEDGGFIVTDTRGLFARDAKLMELAKATGWVTDKMTDVQMTECLSDTMFVSFLAQKAKEYLGNNIVVKGWDCTWSFGLEDLFVIVENKTDVDVSANDYSIESWLHIKPNNWGNYPPMRGHVSVSDLKPHETKKLKINMGEYPDPESKSDIDVKSKINFTISYEDLIKKFFRPTGDEYKEYKALI